MLRTRLLDAAAVLLAAEGPDALSLRRLAADADTSTTAVYSLFGGKPGLFSALFAEAFRRFADHLGAVAPTDDPLEDILALGRAYRASARADPHLYSLMFGSPVPGFEPLAEDWECAEDTFTPILAAVTRALEAGLLRPTDPGLVATAMWANVHGLVSLELGAALPPQAGAPEDVFEAAMQAHLRGWTT